MATTENTIEGSSFFDIGEVSYKEYYELSKIKSSLAGSSDANDSNDRSKILNEIISRCKSLRNPADVSKVTPMKWYEELSVLLILGLGVPGSVFTIPVLVLVIGFITGSITRAVIVSLVVFCPLSVIPVAFLESSLSSWICFQIIRYFSMKFIYEDKIPSNTPRILVAPPHGVFPIGNLLSMMIWPSVFGFSFRGLAASAAIRTPVFRQLLCTIGVIDASKEVAAKALNKGLTIGISTGGVAEVFEANAPSGDEVIVLRNRIGLIRLAFRTGAELRPCYLFGNTHLYDLYAGGPSVRPLIKNLSRQIGFALIVFWGRFYLPVPYRVPILGVVGKAIKVPRNLNPSEAEVGIVLEQLTNDMQALFDKYKAEYGWEAKQLIIQ